ncbi:hypothetical protein ACRAWF_28965 [Streptomyces sp. L7]
MVEAISSCWRPTSRCASGAASESFLAGEQVHIGCPALLELNPLAEQNSSAPAGSS